MTNTVGPPAKDPCKTCPYRTDVPPGVWSANDYAKLPPYDQPTPLQPGGVFLCHLHALNTTPRVCAGWVACHDMDHNLSVRLALASKDMTGDVAEAIYDYQTTVPVFTSGREAADHGMSAIDNPPPAAEAAWTKILRARPDATTPGTRPGSRSTAGET